MKKIALILSFLTTAIILSFTSPDKKIVVIDAGHGGDDTGNVIEVISEKEIVIRIAQRIKQLNDNPNIEIHLTRDSDTFMSLSERMDYVESLKPDLFISLHTDAHSNAETKGITLFTSKNEDSSSASEKLAEKIKLSFSDDFEVRGIKKANFYVLRNSPCPTTMIELGFLTNPSDREMLTSEEGQTKLAKVIYKSLQ